MPDKRNYDTDEEQQREAREGNTPEPFEEDDDEQGFGEREGQQGVRQQGKRGVQDQAERRASEPRRNK